MFEENEFNIFGPCDRDPIALHLLDESVATILRDRGPTVLNVRVLKPETIVRYLKMEPNSLGLVLETNNVSYDVVEWLSKFWTWMSSWVFKDELYPLIGDLHLLPSVNGLRKTSSAIYTMLGVHPALISGFSRLGIPFLNPNFSSPVQRVVSSFRRLSDLNDIPALLDSLDFNHVSTVQLDEEAARVLLNHFRHAPRDLLHEQQRKMRKIPMFPLVRAESSYTTIFWGSLPDEIQLKSVSMGNLPILPVVQDTIFVDGSLVETSLLQVLDPSAHGPLTEHDIIWLSLQHFVTQSMEIKVAFVEYMVKHRDNIPPAIVNSLSQTPFVAVTDGSMQAPENIVDPRSDIADLFLPDDNRFPQTDGQETLIKYLRLLHRMRDTLTTDIVMERLRFISSATSKNRSDITALSRRLLKLLDISRFNCDKLRIDRNLKWLPTQKGLLDHESCHDEGSHPRALFDQVLSLVEPGITISPLLRAALGWNKPLPIQVLADQLSKVLDLRDDDTYGKIEILIKELSQRDLSDNDFHGLCNVIANRPWIPVSGRNLVDTFHAVFSGASPHVGFYQIPFVQGNQREFFLRMGCSEKYNRTHIFFLLSNGFLGLSCPRLSGI
jgi:hypothetical protein